ncbi:hypothetical protein [Salidesulfovibrio brasiliensis]|uniref:hypothetical protein n=1 Tax=Salidesulfovibrio brasiliensis TaxID=221711 RepID=UPI0006D1A21E|nr:hypothetical protein [Salidesulfovibrio brasiliensis]
MRKNVRTVIVSSDAPGLGTLLQKGVGVRGRGGESVRHFLEREVGLAPEYVEQSVRTIFLNCAPADDIDALTVADGDVLSLSAAMPGLVGIAMGRNTLVSGFRSGISAKPGEVREGDALLTVKMFNLVARDAGPELLGRGVFLKAGQIRVALGENAPDNLPDDDEEVLLQTQ